jgi:hypothetical protein
LIDEESDSTSSSSIQYLASYGIAHQQNPRTTTKLMQIKTSSLQPHGTLTSGFRRYDPQKTLIYFNPIGGRLRTSFESDDSSSTSRTSLLGHFYDQSTSFSALSNSHHPESQLRFFSHQITPITSPSKSFLSILSYLPFLSHITPIPSPHQLTIPLSFSKSISHPSPSTHSSCTFLPDGLSINSFSYGFR